MKRTLSLLLTSALLLGLLSSCGEEPGPATSSPGSELSVSELVELILPYSGCTLDPDGLERYNSETGGDELGFYVANAYGLEDSGWEDAAVIRAAGASAFELAVLRCPDEDAAGDAGFALDDYTDARRGDFTGYAPAEADMAGEGSIVQRGTYVALFICPETGLAGDAFTAALNGSSMPDLPGGEAEGSPSPSPDVPATPTGQDPDAEPIPTGQGPDAEPIPTGQDPDAEPIPTSQDPNAVSIPTSQDPNTEPIPTGQDPNAVSIPTSRDPNAVSIPTEHDPNAVPITPSTSQRPERIPFTDPEKDDMSLYDTSAIRAAWAANDPSGLSQYDRAIYDAAKQVLDQTIRADMSGLEKETALYQWIVQNVNYDWTHNNVMMETPRESFTPYGGLVNHNAVCLGYATSFQLLMDLAGVECITVVGAGDRSRQDHGWNMVRPDGNWYCVDVTWDASNREAGSPGLPQNWKYFNVTSDFMVLTDHQWDYDNVPEATAGA